MQGVKKCSNCKKVKKVTKFHHKSGVKGNRQGHCKECNRIRAKKKWKDAKGLYGDWF
tara:strand:+ start:1290 stop:1460 length:171 start_codon:yes stop_codon:yes gene_type:complete